MNRPRSTLRTASIAAVALIAMGSALPALADRDHGGREGGRDWGRDVGHGRGGHEVWHGDIRSFHERDYPLWREGHWERRHHDGRYGWWWVAGGLWFFYPEPIYPYPDPYVPPVVVTPAPAAPAASVPPPAQYWYYCDNAKGYYPYVQSCPGGWRAVPATPATP
jgi:hypothetical protein